MINKLKNGAIFLAVFLAVFLLSGCANQDKLDQQQAQINELQKFKDEQQQKEEQAKKDDCEARLKKAQDDLAKSQRDWGSHQEDLKGAKAGTNGYSYQVCLKSHGCDKECTSQTKNDCRQLFEDNIKTIQGYIQEDSNDITDGESKLVDIKNECAQY